VLDPYLAARLGRRALQKLEKRENRPEGRTLQRQERPKRKAAGLADSPCATGRGCISGWLALDGRGREGEGA